VTDPLALARRLLEVAATLSAEEEARTAALQAARLIHKHKLRVLGPAPEAPAPRVGRVPFPQDDIFEAIMRHMRTAAAREVETPMETMVRTAAERRRAARDPYVASTPQPDPDPFDFDFDAESTGRKTSR